MSPCQSGVPPAPFCPQPLRPSLLALRAPQDPPSAMKAAWSLVAAALLVVAAASPAAAVPAGPAPAPAPSSGSDTWDLLIMHFNDNHARCVCCRRGIVRCAACMLTEGR